MATHLLHVLLLQLSLLAHCLALPGAPSLALVRRLDQLQADREADRAELRRELRGELRSLEEQLVALRGAAPGRVLASVNHNNSTVAKWCDCEPVEMSSVAPMTLTSDGSYEIVCPSGGYVVQTWTKRGDYGGFESAVCCSPCFGDQGSRVWDVARLNAMTSGLSHPRKLFPVLAMACLAAGTALLC
jgi:hypothetical protein